MTTALRQQDIHATPEEYLGMERLSATKHEYLAGMVHAMAGASREHNVISRNLIAALTTQLRGRKCEPFGSDMRLRIRRPDSTFYYYPDVTIDCSGHDSQELEAPTLIIEILSRETERADRGEKLLNYQSLPSMRAYVLVDQYHPAVTIFRREQDGAWKMEFFSDMAADLNLPEIDCAIPLAVVYERVFSAN